MFPFTAFSSLRSRESIGVLSNAITTGDLSCEYTSNRQMSHPHVFFRCQRAGCQQEALLPPHLRSPEFYQHKHVFVSPTGDNDSEAVLRADFQHDNDFEDFRNIKILPTTDEIIHDRIPYLPISEKCGTRNREESVRKYLDKHFRHLRYDNVGSIIDAFNDAARFVVFRPVNPVAHKRETSNGTRYNFFNDVQFESVTFKENIGTSFLLSYRCPVEFRAKPLVDSGILEEGMLCGIVAIHRNTKEINIVLFTVNMRLSTEAMKSKTGDHSRAAVRVILADTHDTAKVRECAHYAHGLYDNVSFYLVDLPSILPISFQAHLQRLQKLSTTTGSMFMHKLALADPLEKLSPSVPESRDGFKYVLNSLKKDHEDKTDFMLAPQSIDSPILSFSGVSRTDHDKNIEDLRQRTTLDEGQAVALFESLNRDLALIQGPPGTGKSYLGVKLVRVLLESRDLNDKRPIIVVCMTNHAVDDFLEAIIASGNTKIVRVGSQSAATPIIPFSLRKIRHKGIRSLKEIRQIGASRQLEREVSVEGLEMAECFGSAASAIQWANIKDCLEANFPEYYGQFAEVEKMSISNVDFRRLRRSGFAFVHWLEGGDLNDRKGLRAQFSRMLGTCDLGDIHPDTLERIQDFVSASIDNNVCLIMENRQKFPLWDLKLFERQQLATRWAEAVDPWEFCKNFAEIHRKHQGVLKSQNMLYHEIDRNLIQNLGTDVIGLTSTGFAKNWDLISRLKPQYLIFEEASQLVEAHSIVCMVPSIKHCIQIGDPKQLRPNIEQSILSKDNDSRFRHDVSLFERLMEDESFPYSRLNVQRRAHPEMADLLRCGDYPFLKDHSSTKNRRPISGLKKRTFWFDHTTPEDVPDPSSSFSKSCSNSFEARLTAELVKYLVLKQGYRFGEITILTPYRGQIALLIRELYEICHIALTDDDRDALAEAKLIVHEENQNSKTVAISLSSMLRITSVDNYQGEQSKVIIFSAVRSNAKSAVGFLKNQNRINVAISRSEEGFIVVGNANQLATVEHWRKIIGVFRDKNSIGPFLELCCPQHSNRVFKVKNPEDFGRAPLCERLCMSVLACGHLCREKCHPSDMHHDGRLSCEARCLGTLPCGHPCPRRCGEPCGGCQTLLSPVELPCGHSVTPTCGSQDSECHQSIDVVSLECGHMKVVQCYQNHLRDQCNAVCGKRLGCGHDCAERCFNCSKNKEHSKCRLACGMKLACGHTCLAECHEDLCPPCVQTCNRHCIHGSCKHPCGEQCDPCIEIVNTCIGGRIEELVCCLSDIIPQSKICEFMIQTQSPLPPDEYAISNDGTFRSKRDDGTDHQQPVPDLIYRRSTRIGNSPREEPGTGNAGSSMSIGSTGVVADSLSSDHCEACRMQTVGSLRHQLGNSSKRAYEAFDLLYKKAGKSLTAQMESMRIAEKRVQNKMSDFLKRIKSGPLLGGWTQDQILERGSLVKDVQDRVIEIREEVAFPIEQSISIITENLGLSRSRPVPTLCFTLRFELIILRGRLAMINFIYHVIKHLEVIPEADMHSIELRSGLLHQTVIDCTIAIDSIDQRLRECIVKVLPRLECEFRVIQVALWTILRALEAQPASTFDPVASLQACWDRMKSWPETTTNVVHAYRTVRDAYQDGGIVEKLSDLYRADRRAKDDLWNIWAIYEPENTTYCDNGHPFARQYFKKGCPECGPHVPTPEPRSVAVPGGNYRDYIDEEAARAYYRPDYLVGGEQ